MKTRQILCAAGFALAAWVDGAILALSICRVAEGHEAAGPIAFSAVVALLLVVIFVGTLADSEGR